MHTLYVRTIHTIHTIHTMHTLYVRTIHTIHTMHTLYVRTIHTIHTIHTIRTYYTCHYSGIMRNSTDIAYATIVVISTRNQTNCHAFNPIRPIIKVLYIITHH